MILALGNPVYDYIKTQRFTTDGRILSGCSTNAALALAKLERKVCLIGAVGKDFKDKFSSDLVRFGIDAAVSESAETGGFSLVYYDNEGNRTLDLLGRANNIDTFDLERLHDAEAVLIGPILKEVSFDLIKEIRTRYSGLYFCDPQGLLRGVDGKGRICHEKPDGIEEIFSLFDIVKPNELEGCVLTGIDCRKDPFAAAREIHSWGPKIVIVTLAEVGSVIFDGKEFIEIPPYEVDLVDPTGAGDTYMAGFVHEYLRGKSLWECGTFASCTSSIMIEHVGPEFPLSERGVRQRQEELLTRSAFKIEIHETETNG
jgi:sugar/nucleoside kinase (ribokinase family)